MPNELWEILEGKFHSHTLFSVIIKAAIKCLKPAHLCIRHFHMAENSFHETFKWASAETKYKTATETIQQPH